MNKNTVILKFSITQHSVSKQSEEDLPDIFVFGWKHSVL